MIHGMNMKLIKAATCLKLKDKIQLICCETKLVPGMHLDVNVSAENYQEG